MPALKSCKKPVEEPHAAREPWVDPPDLESEFDVKLSAAVLCARDIVQVPRQSAIMDDRSHDFTHLAIE